RQASELDPSSIRPLDALGNVLYDQGRLPQAAAAYERRLEIDDAAPAVGYRLALARYRLGDVGGALMEIDRVIALDETLPEAHYLRGLCPRDTLPLAEAADAFEAIGRAPGRERVAAAR